MDADVYSPPSAPVFNLISQFGFEGTILPAHSSSELKLRNNDRFLREGKTHRTANNPAFAPVRNCLLGGWKDLDELTIVCCSLLSNYWAPEDLAFELSGMECKMVNILEQLVAMAESHQRHFHRKKSLTKSQTGISPPGENERAKLTSSAPSASASACALPASEEPVALSIVDLPPPLRAAMHAVLSLIHVVGQCEEILIDIYPLIERIVYLTGSCGDLACALACDLLWSIASIKQPVSCFGRPYVIMRTLYRPLPEPKKHKSEEDIYDNNSADDEVSDEDIDFSAGFTHTQRLGVLRDVEDILSFFMKNRRLWPIWESFIRICAVQVEFYMNAGKKNPNLIFNSALFLVCQKTPTLLYSRFVRPIIENWKDDIAEHISLQTCLTLHNPDWSCLPPVQGSPLQLFVSLATISGHIELLKYLHTKVSEETWLQLVNEVNYRRAEVAPRSLNFAPERMIFDASLHRSLLTLACMSAQPHVVRFLIEAGADTKFRPSALQPIQAAVRAQCPGSIACLLEAGVDISDPSMATRPMGIAMCSPSLDVFKLVSSKSRFDTSDMICHMELSQALELHQTANCEFIIQSGGCRLDRLKEGCIPFVHLAARGGFVTILQSVLEQGVPPNFRDTFVNIGWTPLHYAAYYNRPECIRLLLQHKAQLDPLGGDGHTPLMDACEMASCDAIKVLIEAGANVNWRRRKDQSTPLLELIKGIDRSAFPPIPAIQWTKIREACVALVAAGANVNCESNTKRMTPLHYAVRLADKELIEALLQAGASVNSLDYDHHVPLDYTETIDEAITMLSSTSLDKSKRFTPVRETTATIASTEVSWAQLTGLITEGLDLEMISLPSFSWQHKKKAKKPKGQLGESSDEETDASDDIAAALAASYETAAAGDYDFIGAGGNSSPSTLSGRYVENPHTAEEMTERSRSDYRQFIAALTKNLTIQRIDFPFHDKFHDVMCLLQRNQLIASTSGSLKRCLLGLIEPTPRLTNFQLRIGDHKVDLHRGVFVARFQHSAKSVAEYTEALEEVTDISSTVLVHFKRYLYTDELPGLLTCASDSSSTLLYSIAPETELEHQPGDRMQSSDVVPILVGLLRIAKAGGLRTLVERIKQHVGLLGSAYVGRKFTAFVEAILRQESKSLSKALIPVLLSNKAKLRATTALVARVPAGTPLTEFTQRFFQPLLDRTTHSMTPGTTPSPPRVTFMDGLHNGRTLEADLRLVAAKDLEADFKVLCYTSGDPVQLETRSPMLGPGGGRSQLTQSSPARASTFGSSLVVFSCHEAILECRWPLLSLVVRSSFLEHESKQYAVARPTPEFGMTAEIFKALRTYFYCGDLTDIGPFARNQTNRVLEILDYYGFYESADTVSLHRPLIKLVERMAELQEESSRDRPKSTKEI